MTEAALAAPATTDKRDRILKATADLLVTGGLETPMSRIASRAGVAIGTIYAHFPSKTDLVLGVYARLADQTVAALVPRAERAPAPSQASPDDARARVMDYLHAYIDFFWADSDRAVLFEYMSNVPLIPAADIAEVFRPVREYNHHIFAEAQAAGLLRPGAPRGMVAMVGGGIRNALKWRRVRGEDLTEADRTELAEMCWSAIARPG